MGGRMGGERVTMTNLEVMAIDAAKNILFVKGAVPGAVNGLIMISGAGDLQVNLKKAAALEVAEVKTEEAKAEEAKTAESAAIKS